MTDDEFDAALIGGAFACGAREGWSAVSVAAAAREAGLALDRARLRFAGVGAILRGFGRRADALALADALDSGPVRERLFDVVMRRFDALQAHRAGVLALLRHLPGDPAAALLLAAETTRSMGWMLEGAGVRAAGLRGAVATQGLVGVWLYTMRAWEGDDSADLSGTMAALDRALTRAERLAGWVGAAKPAEPGPKPFPDPEAEIEAASGAVSGAADTPPPEAGAL
jgi:hypothetical protein